MAKDKKRGFLSWLGLKRPDEEQENPRPAPGEADDRAVEQNADTVAKQAAPVAGESDAVRTAKDIVDVTERVAQEQAAVTPAADGGRNTAQAAETASSSPVPRDASVLDSVPAPRDAPALDSVSAPHDASALDSALPPADERPVQRDEAALTLAEDVRPDRDLAPADEWEPEPLGAVMAEPPVTEQARPTREGLFARLKRGLLKTKQNLGSGFIGLFRGKKIDDDLFDELEEQLLIADVGVETTRKIISSLVEHADRSHLKDADALYGKLKEEMAAILAKVSQPLQVGGKTPFVILMVGVNGVGKTTTIGKLAHQYQAEGKTVMLAAGDTFRAAAVEQLQIWGQRNQIPVVAQHTGADSASVIFDAIQAAKARGIDVLIADTAGRLQNKSHLMDELKKIVRVMKKLDADAPHEVMLTLDASTGQNAVSQARLFNETVPLTGITLTKLDGTAKGGVIFAVADQFGIPIRYIGVGEGIEDLRPFNADDFIEALFARED
ncbi:signal recognition particle-docking protein FtsY [Sodalis ligni]|uniref:signal recognition particle-docking protein FtsY n=1 Tax=Sodalis ligni TaxID=2697027 RepID=UPI00193F16C4|nr:signal recognition particle-docking protein FtsY [Sodalis ligni]QWA11439.1 signal recognition particle-docking protein FtsY [Sodalis ligni]